MRQPGRPVVFDDAKQQIFLRLIAAGFSARAAARHVGVSVSAVRHTARKNPAFDAAYSHSKAAAIPNLLETIRGAGQRSWRASAWLLERLCPAQFGRRVALGPDPNIQPSPKKLIDFTTDETIKHFMSQLRFSREGQALAREYLQQVEAEHDAWDAAGGAYDAELKKRGGRPDVFDPPELVNEGDPRPADLRDNSTPEVDQSAKTPSAPQSSNVNNSPPATQSPEAQPEPLQRETTTHDLDEPPRCCSFNP